MAQGEQVYATMRDAVVDMFFKQVLGQQVPKKIVEDKRLIDFVPKEYKKFADDMVVVYLDTISRVFEVSSNSMKNKTVGEILEALEHAKNQAAKYGNRPIKKSNYRKY